MANLFKPQIVRYLDAKGHQVRKGTPGARKVKKKASKWYGQFRDMDGKLHREALCTDKRAAGQMLAKLERDAQRSEVGLTDPHAEHRKKHISVHLSDYETHLHHKKITPKGRSEDMRRLRAVVEGCGFRTLKDMRVEAVERFLLTFGEGTGDVTKNTYIKSIKAFSLWCAETDRTASHVLSKLSRIQKPEIRRERRALTEDELNRLLRATQERPMVWAMTIRRGPRKGKLENNVKPETRAAVERVGLEHALIYKTLALTGLRRGELEALEVRHLTLTGRRPCLVLPKEATKNREKADIPLRADLAADLAQWIERTGKRGTDRVFNVSPSLNTLLKRDLKWAGIPYRDEMGKTIDVHALRHTTASHLARGGVSPKVAQGFMRHHDIRLTMEVYTDPRLLDEREALEALPALPLDGKPTSRRVGQSKKLA
jgi:integrase